MADMLVNLLRLPPLDPVLEALGQRRITVRRGQAFEITPVRAFIEQNFSVSWADEVTMGFNAKPTTVFIATHDGKVIGFAAYECTRRNFFGPTGVAPSMRGHGIGKALLVACLQAMRELGYVYGIIGGVGPVEFYKNAVGASLIDDSTPGIYTDLLK